MEQERNPKATRSGRDSTELQPSQGIRLGINGLARPSHFDFSALRLSKFGKILLG